MSAYVEYKQPVATIRIMSDDYKQPVATIRIMPAYVDYKQPVATLRIRSGYVLNTENQWPPSGLYRSGYIE